ncbi:MAG: transposase [Desulfuromonadaceae bacterium]
MQEGIKLPEQFLSRTDWHDRLEKVSISGTTKLIIASFMKAIEGLSSSEDELETKIVAIGDERIKRLESIPGIGKLSSRTLLGALDEANRFDNKKAAAKYGALTPTIYQSDNVTHMGHICRNGRHEIRRVLLQCAHTVARMKNFESKPLREFFERIHKRRGKKIAVVALARKLLTIAFGILKAETYFDPKMLSPNRA